jgi:pyruvate kinase
MRRTKIVCTLGPAVDSPENLALLAHAGMDVARLNFSHGTHDDHAARYAAVRSVARAVDRPIAVLQDLCGPKIRIGSVTPGTVLSRGGRLVLTGAEVEGDATRVTLPIPELRDALQPGHRLLLDDGILELRVVERDGDDVVTEVVIGGALGGRKGICAPGVPLDIDAVTQKDEADVRFGLSLGVDYVALSFVRRAADVERLRTIMAETGQRVPILVKIEKAEAVANLDEILAVSDGAMVARGDLGVEMPIEEIAMVQKRIIRACNRRGLPVITATQMLDSMIRNPRPTRAEVTDIANAVLDGTDALMLSGETAVGAYPIDAVRTMARIAEVTEDGLDYAHLIAERHVLFGGESVTDAVADAVTSIAEDQHAAAILCATEAGGTARSVAKFRPRTPILAATTNPETCNRLALVWGVTPLRVPRPLSVDALLSLTVAAAEERGLVHDGDLVVITSGTPIGIPGTTNLIKVHRIGQPL